MNKAQPLDWHKQTLQNFKANYERALKLWQAEQARFKEWKAEIEFRELQIATAEKLGKREYDAERFCAKKG